MIVEEDGRRWKKMEEDGRRWKKLEEDGRSWKKLEEEDGKKKARKKVNKKLFLKVAGDGLGTLMGVQRAPKKIIST